MKVQGRVCHERLKAGPTGRQIGEHVIGAHGLAADKAAVRILTVGRAFPPHYADQNSLIAALRLRLAAGDALFQARRYADALPLFRAAAASNDSSRL